MRVSWPGFGQRAIQGNRAADLVVRGLDCLEGCRWAFGERSGGKLMIHKESFVADEVELT